MEDRQICLRLIENNHFLWVNETLYNRRKHKSQLTTSTQEIRNSIRKWVIERTLKQWGGEFKAIYKKRGDWIVIKRLKPTRKKRKKKMKSILHYKYNVGDSHTTAQILHLPSYRGVLMVKKTSGFSPERFGRIYSYKKIKNFKHLFKKHNIKAVHAHHGTLGVKLLHLKKKFDIPFITSFRGKDATAYPKDKKNRKALMELFQIGDVFLPVCRYLADRLRNLGCPEEKIHVLYGGTDLERFRYMPRQFTKKRPIRLLGIGRFVEKKGFHYLISAFACVHEKHPNTELLLIGKGEMEKKYKKMIQKLELQDHVQIQNWVDYRSIQSIYYDAHIFCAPSCTDKDGNQEGIPNTLKEAMATGMPVIATNHAGIPELVVHEKSGLLVEEKEIAPITASIIRLLKNPEQWESMGREARMKMEIDFDVFKQTKKQEQIYNELLEKHRKKRKG